MFEADIGSLFSANDEARSGSGEKSPSARKLWSLMPRSLLPTTNNFTSLIDRGRSVTSHVQSLIGERESTGSVRLWPDGNEGTADNGQLLKNVSVAFERQEAINKNNAQLTKINYLANVANYMKHQQVEKAVVSGQRQLSRMHNKILEQANTIDSLNTSVTSLEVDVQCTQDTCSRLDRSLRSQQDLLHTSIRENREALEQQNSILIKQQNMVQKLMRQRVRHDFMIDAGLLATAIYLCNGVLVDFPLQMVLQVVPNTKLRKWTRQFSKVLLVIKVVTILKSITVKCGIHNSVGSLLPYIREGWGISKSQVSALLHHFTKPTTGGSEETELKQVTTTKALDLC